MPREAPLEECHTSLLVTFSQAIDLVDKKTQARLQKCAGIEEIHQALDTAKWMTSLPCVRHSRQCDFPSDLDLVPWLNCPLVLVSSHLSPPSKTYKVEQLLR